MREQEKQSKQQAERKENKNLEFAREIGCQRKERQEKEKQC